MDDLLPNQNSETTPEPAEAVETEPSAFEKDFLSGFESDFDDLSEAEAEEAPAVEEVLAEGETPEDSATTALEAPAGQPAVQAAPAQATPQQSAAPTSAVAQPQQQQQQQTPTPPVAAEPTPLLHELISKNQSDWVKQLASSAAFQLPKEEAELFDDPRVAQFVSNNNARVFLQTMSAVSQLLHNTLPQTVREVTSVQKVAADYEREFFDANSDLQKPEYEPLLRNLLVGLRQANPQASRQDLQRMLAASARAALNLPSQTAVATPAATAVTKGVKQVARKVAFVPAANAAAGAGSTQRTGQPAKKSDIDSLIGMLSSPDLD